MSAEDMIYSGLSIYGKFRTILVSLFLLILAVCLFYASYKMYKKNTIKIDAKVVDQDQSRMKLTFTYKGKDNYISLPLTANKIGDIVTIYINLDNPLDVSTSSNKTLAYMLAGFGLFTLFVIWSLIYFTWKYKFLSAVEGANYLVNDLI